jgi:hypothetical protein
VIRFPMTELRAESEEGQASAKSLRDQVHEWIERQGYPLEMTVANAFTQRSPAFVEQSKYYRDSTTGEIREADVVAIYSGILPGEGGKAWLTAYVIVECKGDRLRGLSSERAKTLPNMIKTLR